MLNKYKIFVWNSLFLLTIFICFTLILPRLQTNEKSKLAEQEIPPLLKNRKLFEKYGKGANMNR